MTRRRVVVLGGGACGLSAAFALAQNGAQPIVLEAEPRPGGLCGTVERDGFRFDFGGHRFITRNREIDAMVRELVGDELLERTRSSIILNGGRRFRYPLALDDVLASGGLARGARSIASYAIARVRHGVSPAPDVSFEDWVSRRFGRYLYDSFFGPYTEKLWGVPPTKISSDWASQRISLLSASDVLWRLFGLRRGGARTYARRYLYPRKGIGQIFNRMAIATSERGGDVRLGARVIGLDTRAGKIRAVRFRDASGEHEIGCDAVISTISLPLLARMLGGMTEAASGSARRLRFRAIRLLNILLDGASVTPHTWMYVSDPAHIMTRIQEPRHRSPEMAPPGMTSLMLEIPCEIGDQTWRATDEALYERCVGDLTSLGLPGLRDRTRSFFSTFVSEGYPVYHLEYERDRAQLLAHVSATRNVVTCGRQGAFRYVFMDTAMEMGLAAAAWAMGDARAGASITEMRAERELLETSALTA